VCTIYIVKPVSIEHYIQRRIFNKLRLEGNLRYKDLRILDIESSQFVYHLKELIKSGVVEKLETGQYRLAQSGMTLAQGYSLELNNFRITVPSYTVVFCKSIQGRWLVFRRNREPLMGLLSAISGKYHQFETAQKSVECELSECLDEPQGLDPECIGSASIIIHNLSTKSATHITCTVWFVDSVDEAKLVKDYPKGRLFWCDWQQEPYDDFIPGWAELIEMIELRNTNFLDLEFTL
jgi:hypothetical protein